MSEIYDHVETLARLIQNRKCPEKHETSGQCIGEIKLYHYPWCDQYRIACSHCGKVVKVEGFNLDPMPHRIVNFVKGYLAYVKMKDGESIYVIRRRFRDIEYQAQRASKELFS